MPLVVSNPQVQVHEQHANHDTVDPRTVNHEHQPNEIDMADHNEVISIRKSQRQKKSAIPSDYVVYLQETKYDFGDVSDLITFNQAMNSEHHAL